MWSMENELEFYRQVDLDREEHKDQNVDIHDHDDDSHNADEMR